MKKIITFTILVCLLLTSCHTQEVKYSDEWGLELVAENVTDKGMTLKFVQLGGAQTGELQTGAWYTIDRKVEDNWETLETETIDFAWNMMAYLIKENDTTELEVDWEWLYGRLPAGEYRINKEVTDFRGTGDFDKQIYSAEFSIDKK